MQDILNFLMLPKFNANMCSCFTVSAQDLTGRACLPQALSAVTEALGSVPSLLDSSVTCFLSLDKCIKIYSDLFKGAASPLRSDLARNIGTCEPEQRGVDGW